MSIAEQVDTFWSTSPINFSSGSKLMSVTDQSQQRHNQQYQDMQSRFNAVSS